MVEILVAKRCSMTGAGEVAGVTSTAVLVKTLLEKTTLYEDAFSPAAKAFGNTAKPAGAAVGRTVSALAKAGHNRT